MSNSHNSTTRVVLINRVTGTLQAPAGRDFDSSQGTDPRGMLTTRAPAKDAIINSGPPSIGANPIQIRVDDGLTSLPCSGSGAGSGARSYHRSSVESRRACRSRWILLRLHRLRSHQGSGRRAQLSP